MPELPDVETMRRYLQATSLHQTVDALEVRDVVLLPDDPAAEETTRAALREGVVGRSFAATHRHGKYLLVALEGDDAGFLVLHFGMTGGLKYSQDEGDEPEDTQVLFRFENGYRLAYQATRKLGQVALVDAIDEFVETKELGPDALDPDFDLPAFREVVAGRRAMVKSLLMDQGTIAGIGNVYADEILFQAGIHPRTKVNALDDARREELFHVMKDVLETAIEHQAQPDRLPDSFLLPHRHEGGTCPRCGTELARVKVSSRSAYYCPNRQPA
jgi:formamidopyrimidine-DNA glycosylase